AELVAAELGGQGARAGPDAALPVEALGARSGADAALGDRAAGQGGDGVLDVLDGDVAAADVVEVAVIGLADHGVDRTDLGVAGLGQGPFHGAGHALGDGKRVGQ